MVGGACSDCNIYILLDDDGPLMKLRNLILYFVHNYMWIRGFPVYE